MEIKRRLTAVAKRFGNEVEGLNTAVELRRICKRLEELADYTDAKLERAKEAEKTGHGLMERHRVAAQELAAEQIAMQEAEMAEQVADQEEAKEAKADAG